MAVNVDEPSSNAFAPLSAVPAALIELAASYAVIDVNPVGEQFLARPREQIVGTHWMDFVEPADRAALTAALSGAEGERIHSVTFRIMLPDGSRRWWSCGLRAERGNENGCFWLVANDSTQSYAELAHRHRERRLMSLAALATSIAHELNQPLHAMRLAVQNVLRHLSGARIDRRFLIGKFERIDRLVGRTAQLADDVRQIGHYASDNCTVADLESAVEEAIALTRIGALGPKVEVRLRQPVHCRPVLVSSDRLEQVIVLLLLAIAWRSSPADQWHYSDTPSLIDIELDDAAGSETVTLRMIDGVENERHQDVPRANSLFAFTRGLVHGMGASLQMPATEQGRVVEIVMPAWPQESDS